MTRATRIALCVFVTALLAAAGGGWWLYLHSSASSGNDSPLLAPTLGAPWFVDVTQSAGIDFVHFDSVTDVEFIMETMGSGVAWIDYDADGWPDLFFVQDGPLRPGFIG